MVAKFKLQSKSQVSSSKTLLAAKKFNRRAFVKGAAVSGGVALSCGPWIVKDAFSSSGTLNLLLWSDYLPKRFVRKFESLTGIKVVHTGYGSNEEMENRVRRTKGRGYELVGPTHDRGEVWKEYDLLKPIDMNRVPTEKILPSMLKISQGFSWDGEYRHLPYLWGTEALAWRTDLWTSEYGKLSFGDLWQPELKGLVMGRPHSMLSGIGRYLERKGKLPPFIDSYLDEETMRVIWDEIISFAIDHKSWVKLFWNDFEGQINGLMQNGVSLGQTWDGPALRLQKTGEPIQYMAPVEGAFTWLDGLSIPVGAKNVEGAYEFINFLYNPEYGGLLANETGYNSVCKGLDEFLSSTQKKAFASAYPDDALDRLWPWPAVPKWYADLRQEYTDRYIVA